MRLPNLSRCLAHGEALPIQTSNRATTDRHELDLVIQVHLASHTLETIDDGGGGRMVMFLTLPSGRLPALSWLVERTTELCAPIPLTGRVSRPGNTASKGGTASSPASCRASIQPFPSASCCLAVCLPACPARHDAMNARTSVSQGKGSSLMGSYGGRLGRGTPSSCSSSVAFLSS